MSQPDCVLEETREPSGAGEFGETWIQDQYELLGGDRNSFLRPKVRSTLLSDISTERAFSGFLRFQSNVLIFM